jgi:hypothetical protein
VRSPKGLETVRISATLTRVTPKDPVRIRGAEVEREAEKPLRKLVSTSSALDNNAEHIDTKGSALWRQHTSIGGYKWVLSLS